MAEGGQKVCAGRADEVGSREISGYRAWWSDLKLGVMGWVVGRGSTFEIRLRPGGRVTVRGRLPAAKKAAILGFFGEGEAWSAPLAVWGWSSADRPGSRTGPRLQLRLLGRLSARQRQRLRNYLIELLG